MARFGMRQFEKMACSLGCRRLGHAMPSIFRVLACFLACLSDLIVTSSVIQVGICAKIAFIKDGVFYLSGNVLVLENQLTQCVTRDNQQQKRRKKNDRKCRDCFHWKETSDELRSGNNHKPIVKQRQRNHLKGSRTSYHDRR